MIVNKLDINMIALAVGLAFSAGAMAQGLSKNDYDVGKNNIAAEYQLAKAGCAPLSGNPNDICVAEAKAREKIATADLDASYKPAANTRYKARVAKAEANNAVANERCDSMAGNAKDVCVKEAKATETGAKADAKVQMKTSQANAIGQREVRRCLQQGRQPGRRRPQGSSARQACRPVRGGEAAVRHVRGRCQGCLPGSSKDAHWQAVSREQEARSAKTDDDRRAR